MTCVTKCHGCGIYITKHGLCDACQITALRTEVVRLKRHREVVRYAWEQATVPVVKEFLAGLLKIIDEGDEEEVVKS